MKNLVFTILLSALFVSGYSQSKYGTEYLIEDFENGVPPTDWTVENYTAQWTASGTENAGGNAPELRFMYTNGMLTTRFISPEIDLTDVTNLILSFKHFVDYYGAGFSIGVATRSGEGEWNSVWEVSPSGNIGPLTNEIEITNDDLGAENFQFCFYLSGNAYQIDFWYIDDVMLYTPFDNDITIISTDVPIFSEGGEKTISATVKNVGYNTLNSFDIKYQIDDGEIFTKNISELNLDLSETYPVEFDETWFSTPGTYELNIWVENMNGNGADEGVENDLFTETLYIATQSTENFPLIESFTSSTCPPCQSFNSSFFNNFLEENQGELAIIKYQMSWPSPGDDYYTEEGGVRRAYYGVSSVPDLFIGGSSVATSSSAVNNAFGDENVKPAFFELSANHTITENIVDVNIDILPFVTAPEFTVHAVVVEKMTTGNVGSNGETEFHYVMMKMLPDADGTIIDFTAEESYTFSLSQDLTSTNIEEFTDLAVMVFIQNDKTKEVFQSCISVDYSTPMVTSNILNNQTDVASDIQPVLTFSQPIRFIDDSEITENDIHSFVSLFDDNKADIDFSGTINEDKTEITIIPTQAFEYESNITIQIAENAVENFVDIALDEFSITFTTENNPLGVDDNFISKINVYPNPAKEYFIVDNVMNQNIEIFNILGEKLLEKFSENSQVQIYVNDFKSGIYIIKVSSENASVTKFINIAE